MTGSKQKDSAKNRQLREIDLFNLSAKLFAIGELIKFRGGEPSHDEERVNFGIGEILTDLADDLYE